MNRLVQLLSDAGYDIDRKTVDLLLNFNRLTNSDPSVISFLKSMRPVADAVDIARLEEVA